MRTSALASALLTAGISLAQAAAPPTDDLVKAVHAGALTVDTHLDIRNGFNTGSDDPGKETADQFDLPKLERGQLDVAVVALFADPAKRTPANIAAARQQVDVKYDALKRFVAAHPDRLEFARSSADIERIARQGKHAIVLSFLNTLPLGEDLSQIAKYRDKGVRVFGFVHAQNTPFADSSRPNLPYGDRPDEHGGLTPLGRSAVTELNRLGVIVDVSQLTPAGVKQAVELSRAPVIASHSGLRSRVDVPRNLTDEELRAIAAKGGVVNVVAFAAYLTTSPKFRQDYNDKVWAPFGLKQGVDDPKAKLSAADYERYLAGYREFSRNEWRYATIADYVDAVGAAVKLVGIDHVGLSSDFNHGGGVTGYASVGDGPNVTRELLRRGYSEADIAKLWGGNFLRVLREVEKVAAKAGAT